MLQMRDLLCKFDCDDLYIEEPHVHNIVCLRNHWEKYSLSKGSTLKI